MFRNTHPGTALFLLLCAGAIYVAVLVAPHYVDRMDMREAVDTAFAQAAASSDERLRAIIREHTREMSQHEELDEFGNKRIVPGVGDDKIAITHDPYTGAIRIAVEFKPEVRFVPTSYVRRLNLSVAKEGMPPPFTRN